MTDFYSNFHGYGLNAEEYFYKQVFDTFDKNARNKSLPFFNMSLNKLPREITTGKTINDENDIDLEQMESLKGWTSNLWIYGDELNKIQSEIGTLVTKKGAEPVLCLTKYFNATHLNEQELYIADGGSGKKEQYLYNIDSLSDRSREKLLNYYSKKASYSLGESEEEVNFKAFQSNKELNKKGGNAKLQKVKEKVAEKSREDGIDLLPVTSCSYMHNLANSIGKPEAAAANNKANESACYKSALGLSEKVDNQEISVQRAGKIICKALSAGIELQRVAVAKNYNLENAKKIEEMKVADSNRRKAKAYGGMSY